MEKDKFPGIGRCNSRLSFPRHYFYINYFSLQILERSCHGEYQLFEKILSTNKRQLMYIMLWLKVGKDLEQAIEIIKTERLLKIKHLQDRVRIHQHPDFRSKVKDVHTLNISKYMASNLTDKAVLLWSGALEDFLFCASEHLQHFIAATYNTMLPFYPGIARRSSNRG